MPTEELDQILQAELEKEYPNEEVVLPILQILEQREKDAPIEKTPEVLAILSKLSKQEPTSKQSTHKRRWFAGIAAVAAVACFVVMIFPQTVGAESFLEVLIRWTESVFEYFTPEQDASNPPVDIVFETDNPGLQQLYEKVTELGATEFVVPMWLPEGFVLSELSVYPMSGGNKVSSKFKNGNDGILITYRISTDITTKFEKEDSSFEVYDYANVCHFILENDENVSVTWTVDGVECSILTDVGKEAVYNMIKSIYRRSLE